MFLGKEKILLRGPLAVQPNLSFKGFGKQLVRDGFQRALNSVPRLFLVSGLPHYYPRFGFVPASD